MATQPGPLAEEGEFEFLLEAYWDEFNGSDAEGMTVVKLYVA